MRRSAKSCGQLIEGCLKGILGLVMLAAMAWLVFAIFSNVDSTDEPKPVLEVTARAVESPAPAPSCPTPEEASYFRRLSQAIAPIGEAALGLGVLFALIEGDPTIIYTDEFRTAFVLHAATISASGDAILKLRRPDSNRARLIADRAPVHGEDGDQFDGIVGARVRRVGSRTHPVWRGDDRSDGAGSRADHERDEAVLRVS